jgi:hypothetical protein
MPYPMAAARGHATGAVAGFTDPTSITGCILWLDFSDATTMFTDAGSTQVSADAQAIYQVNDKSPSGFNFTQTAPGARPTYKTGIYNSQSVARFDGGDWLDNTTFDFDPRTRTLFMVLRETTAVNYARALVVKTGVSNLNDYDRSDGFVVVLGDNSYLLGIQGAASGSYQVTQGSTGALPLSLYIERKTTGSGALYLNGGTAVATDNSFTEFDASAGGGIVLGTQWLNGGAAGGVKMIGDWCELVIYDTQLSPADTNSVGNYLATKWGLTWSAVS